MNTMWADKIKRYYEAGSWNKKMVLNAVSKGKITAREYESIVGEPCGEVPPDEGPRAENADMKEALAMLGVAEEAEVPADG